MINTVPFLRQVAEHYIDTGFPEKIFVFPNRRSMAFFKKYIGDCVKERGGQPVIAPRMMGVNDFFAAMTGRRAADRITLLLKLYDCYKVLYSGQESLDDFIYWGDALISDFDDIDKYQIDAAQLFTNILDLKELGDDFSHLTDEQIEAIRKLSDHFTAENWNRDAQRSIDVKERFLKLWTIMHALYENFRKSLADSGLAYEGMVYRELAERLKTESAREALHAVDSRLEGCVFIGLNTLNSCEHDVFKAMQNEGLAEFCWDFTSSMVTDPQNQASRFMAENVREFPNAFRFDTGGLPVPEVNIISVASSTGQAKVLRNIINSVDKSQRGLDFAVVLPDESMLLPVLSSLPDVDSVNVTMGYPLSSSEWNSLMRSIIALHVHMRDGRYFYHRQVGDIFSSGIIKAVCDDADKACALSVQKQAKAFIPIEDFNGGEVFSCIFHPVDPKELASYLCEVVETIASRMDKDEDALTLECAYRYLQCMHSLESRHLDILPKTFVHLVEQLVAGESVPFAGEPLGGLQIMGPLETRALDFRNLVILNANEGTFPGRNIKASYIPPELRKAFGLPTYELQDSVWAYYFYRMIARSEKVWMVFDSRTEGLVSGEESRYVKQLQYLYSDRCKLHRFGASSSLGTHKEDEPIAKTDEDIQSIKSAMLSASSIHMYLQCPVSFYYYVIKKLYPKDEATEDLDRGMLGTVCHDTLQAIYCCEEAMSPSYFFDKRFKDDIAKRTVGKVDESFIKGWLARKSDIRKKVMALICHELHAPAVEGRNLVAAEIAVEYVLGVLRADLKLIKKHGTMRIVGLEKTYSNTVLGHNFKGYVDRMDEFSDGTFRIVDYKTGSDRQSVLDPALGGPSLANNIFNGKVHEFKAAFQFYLYDKMVAMDPELSKKKIHNSMYSISELFTNDIEAYEASQDVMSAIDERLKTLLDEMENIEIPFKRTPGYEDKNCRLCNYTGLCGKAKKKI